MPKYVLGLLASLALGGNRAQAQEAGPATDPTPLAKPQPVVTLPGSGKALYDRLQKVLTRSGFHVTVAQPEELALEAQRNDSASPSDYDRVIIWLQCRPLKSKQYDVFLLYGRYDQLMGNHVGVSRVVVDENFENDHIGQVRSWIIALADTLGGSP